MAKSFDQLPAREALVEIARSFYQRGWMPGTAGNLSAVATRDAAGTATTMWITGSGLPKGQLEATDFLRIAVADGTVVEPPAAALKPSAETCIHQAIYRQCPKVGACLHVHTVDACLAVRRAPANATSLRLPPLEMVKGLGIWDENPRITLPLFQNHGDVNQIARDIEQQGSALQSVPALMIRDHGVTVWGSNVQEAFNRVECIEFIFSFMART